MAETAGSSGTAHDATVAARDGDPAGGKRYAAGTPQHGLHLAYLDQVAEDADAAVAAVEGQIADLKASLAERRQAAKQARAELAAERKREG